MTSVTLILVCKCVLYKRYYWKIINQNVNTDYGWVLGLRIILNSLLFIFPPKFPKIKCYFCS